MPQPIYLDYNGTTPHDPEVIEAMRPFFETEFGNPSSSHWYGIAPKQAVENARRQVAALLGCTPEELVFTSGGTESNNQVIKSMAGARYAEGTHIITSRIEHPAVLEVCQFMEEHGFSVTYLPVDETGLVDPSDIEAAVTDATVLISIMHANNEVGTIQPIEEIAEIANRHEILFHTDAAQSLGKIPAKVDDLGVGLLSVAGHKLYAPKGVGALYLKSGIEPKIFCHGAGQERGVRAGTENVLEIVGLGKACEIAGRDLAGNNAHMAAMRDRLEAGIQSTLSNVRFNGHRQKRLPNTCSVSFLGLEANRILEEIGLEVAASAGAACHSDRVQISHVLTAMNIPEEWAKGTLRFTTGRMTTEEEIDRALEVIVSAVKRLK
ncbi:MAG: cysteine desulfurase [Desulfobacterales bacterium]|nr:cysteine desulfurase [Desulfobacterales bacterium]